MRQRHRQVSQAAAAAAATAFIAAGEYLPLLLLRAGSLGGEAIRRRKENASKRIAETNQAGLIACSPSFMCWSCHNRGVCRLLCVPHEEVNWQ